MDEEKNVDAPVEEVEIEESTEGIKTFNGVEIYEGDVVKYKETIPSEIKTFKGVIEESDEESDDSTEEKVEA